MKHNIFIIHICLICNKIALYSILSALRKNILTENQKDNTYRTHALDVSSKSQPISNVFIVNCFSVRNSMSWLSNKTLKTVKIFNITYKLYNNIIFHLSIIVYI